MNNRHTRKRVWMMAGLCLLLALFAVNVGRLLVIEDRKSTRLNSSHLVISYAVFCLKKKNNTEQTLVAQRQEHVSRFLAPIGTQARSPSTKQSSNELVTLQSVATSSPVQSDTAIGSV